MNVNLYRPSLGLTVATQVFLGLLFLAGLMAIAILPSFSADVATTLPEYAELREPLLAICIAFTVLGLVALATVALLVHRIFTGTMLRRASLPWVNAMTAILACAALLDIVAFFVISDAQAGNPFIALIQALVGLTLTALVCITVVLRSLLRNAITMRNALVNVA